MPRAASRRTIRSKSPETTWNLFIRGREQSQHLASPALYTIPKRLIQILSSEVPSLFTAEDVNFEIALREHGGSAFVNHEPYLYRVLDARFLTYRSSSQPLSYPCPEFAEFPHAMSIPDLMKQVNEGQSLDFMHHMSGVSKNKRLLEQHHNFRIRFDDQIQLRMRGYAGWLVTNPTYWVDALRAMTVGAGDLISVKDRHCPSNSDERRKRADFLRTAFLTKWTLSRVLSYFLPEPLRPELFPGDSVPRNSVDASGVSMFLPWPFFVDQAFQVRGLADYYWSRNDLSHFQDWLHGQERWGHERFARLFELFVYLELALKPRYPNQIRGRLQQIDRAFARYWSDEEADRTQIEKGQENARRIRLKLQQRLKVCRQEIHARFDAIVSGQDTEYADLADKMAALLPEET